MIEVKKLAYTYPGKDRQAVKGISFSVDEGEIFGFLGPSGAGKSTVQKPGTAERLTFSAGAWIPGAGIITSESGFPLSCQTTIRSSPLWRTWIFSDRCTPRKLKNLKSCWRWWGF